MEQYFKMQSHPEVLSFSHTFLRWSVTFMIFKAQSETTEIK